VKLVVLQGSIIQPLWGWDFMILQNPVSPGFNKIIALRAM